jgi:glutathione S-transferase
MPLVVHHLQTSQSERIAWLCQELGVQHELRIYKRAPMMAPSEYKVLHPLGAAPVIQDGGLTLAESGACIHYICHKYADGQLFLQPTHPEYASFLYWWYWASGTFQPSLARGLLVRSAEIPDDNQFVKILQSRFTKSLELLDGRLHRNEWLAGQEFTVADIMVVFSLTTMRSFYPYSLRGYDNVLKYLGRISKRKAYQEAMAKADAGLPRILGPDPPTNLPA